MGPDLHVQDTASFACDVITQVLEVGLEPDEGQSGLSLA
jgi:hypothetical protein